MLPVKGFIFLAAIICATSEEIPSVEPEYLDQLRASGNHEEFARLTGIDDVNLVIPSNETSSDMSMNKVSPLGDIMLTAEQARQGLRFEIYKNSKWPNRRIPYVISSDFDDKEKNEMYGYISEFNSQSSYLKLVRRRNENDYVIIINGNGCWSYLGRIGNQQSMSLQRQGCIYRGIVYHEFLHAAGFTHEHNRFDRDDYVRVRTENIPSDWQSQYEKVSAKDYEYLGPYDYCSCMHYGMRAPGTNLEAFEIKYKNVDSSCMGQRNYLTDTDISKINKMYQQA